MKMENLFVAAILGVIGFLIGSLIRTSYMKDMLLKASITPFYWKFVIPFVIAVGFSYWSVFTFVAEPNQSLAIDIVGQMTALIFAIFVGWYAFIQVVNAQAEKTMERAHEYFVDGQYERAKKQYLDAYNLRPNDFSNNAELLELYIVSNQDEGDFNQKMKHFEKIAVGYRERLVVNYLKTMRSLLRQDLGTANTHIANTIHFISEHPGEDKGIQWEFKELTNSKRYKTLGADSEAKIKLDNYLKFLQKILPEADIQSFKEGDYFLHKQ